MRINMCAAIMVMQSVFLIGAHVKAQQVIVFSRYQDLYAICSCG